MHIYLFLYKNHFSVWASIFLTFPEIEAEIFLTFIAVNLIEEVTTVCYRSLIFINQGYQRTASVCVEELAKNELISISGK